MTFENKKNSGKVDVAHSRAFSAHIKLWVQFLLVLSIRSPNRDKLIKKNTSCMTEFCLYPHDLGKGSQALNNTLSHSEE